MAVSISRARLGGREYDLLYHRQCTVCNHPQRPEIERRSLQQYSYSSTMRHLDSFFPNHGLKIDAIRRHNAHIPVDASIRRVISKERNEELANNLQGFEDALGDHIAFLRLGVQRAFERMASGEIEPTISEGAAMARILAQLEEKATPEFDHAALVRGFVAYCEATKGVLAEFAPGRSHEAMQSFGARLRADPVMRALMDGDPTFR